MSSKLNKVFPSFGSDPKRQKAAGFQRLFVKA
jgi:hypothetical protein